MNYYKISTDFETIDIIEQLGYLEGFCFGNIIKYITRAGKKEGESELEDLNKAKYYLDKLINKLMEVS